jgi:hypothetical protein
VGFLLDFNKKSPLSQIDNFCLFCLNYVVSYFIFYICPGK